MNDSDKLSSIIDKLDKLLNYEIRKIPTGYYTHTFSITEEMSTVNVEKPWISLTITNDGAGSIWFRINTLQGSLDRESEIGASESVSIDFNYATVTKLFMQAATSGGTATVKVHAQEGCIGALRNGQD